MAYPSKSSVMTCAYPTHTTRKRMERVARRLPEFTLSKQLTEGITRILPELEAKAGLKKFTNGA